MSTVSPSELWQTLQQQGLVSGDMPARSAQASPWFVRIMLGVAGWIGALFLFGFVGAAFEKVFDSAGASFTLGLMGCGAAYAVFRMTERNDFGTQFGLALSFAAQGLFFNGVFKGLESEHSAVFFILFIFEALLALVIPNFIHRVLTSWGAMLALMLSMVSMGIYGLATGITAALFAVIWLNEWQWAKYSNVLRPIGYGLTLALLHIQTIYFLGMDFFDLWPASAPNWWLRHTHFISTTLVGCTLIWVVMRQLASQNVAQHSPAGLATIVAAVLLGLLSFIAPGMATALLILVLGFASANRLLMGLGLLALGGFISHYYYQLYDTLLFKSMVLAISGMVLLFVYLGLKKYFPVSQVKESEDA